MSHRSSQPARIGRERVREMLSLAVWQFDLAVKTGLLDRGPDGKFDTVQVQRAQRSKTWRPRLEQEYRLNATDAAARLGCAVKAFTKLASDHGLVPVESRRTKGGTVQYWRAVDIDSLKEKPDRSRARAKQITVEQLAEQLDCDPKAVAAAAAAVGARVQRSSDGSRVVASSHAHSIKSRLRTQKNVGKETKEVQSRVSVAVRDRRREPGTVRIHLGPTNSGKTYQALQRLAESGSGVYAAPLRMLAREAYEKLSAQVGEKNVGLLTGEEEINPGAPIICCTAEMAPDRGKTLVLDEAHWARDEDRGYAWTRLLVGAQYDTIEVAASRGAAKFLEHVFTWAPDSEVVQHNRLSKLSFSGDTTIEKMPAKTLLVAFSRKAVHTLAARLLAAGRTVGVLYGALPPENRTQQIDEFVSGNVEILVTTDVIGHGINVPAQNVVFAQTDKYDGKAHRDLELWEAAQIAGRAGRYGLADSGHVYALTGQLGFTPDREIVREAAKAAAGKIPDGLDITAGLIRPRFGDLGEPEAHQLGVAIAAWETLAAEELASRPEVTPVPAEALVTRFLAAATVMGLRGGSLLSHRWPVDGNTLWQALTVPIDFESPVFAPFIKSIATGHNQLGPVLEEVAKTARYGLEEAEHAASVARDVMVVARCFPEIAGNLYKRASAVERSAAKTVDKTLAEALRSSEFGQCRDCGGQCAPHFRYCDKCYAAA